MAMFPIEPNPAAGNDPFARLQMLVQLRQQMAAQQHPGFGGGAPPQMGDALARLHALLTPPDVAAQTPLPPQGIHWFGSPGAGSGVAYPNPGGERQTIAPRVPGDPNGPLVYHHTPPHMPQFPQYSGVPGQVEGDTGGRQQPMSSLVQAAVGRGVVNGMKTPPRVPVGFAANRYVAQFGH